MPAQSKILAEVLLLIDNSAFGSSRTAMKAEDFFTDSASESNKHKNLAAESLESYLRIMLSSCATSVLVPGTETSYWSKQQNLLSLLSPSARKRFQFVDSKGHLWSTIEQYFHPIVEDIKSRNDLEAEYFKYMLNYIAWDFYRFALSIKGSAEVILNLKMVREYLVKLQSIQDLANETHTRLALIEGVFASYSKSEEIPGLGLCSFQMNSLRERVAEILDDAYLLEASTIRRFLSIRSNVAALKRDLREILKFIVKNRSWAKGIAQVVNQQSLFPELKISTLNSIIKYIPSLSENYANPILIHPESLYTTKDFYFIKGKRNVTSKGADEISFVFDEEIHPLRLLLDELQPVLYDFCKKGKFPKTAYEEITQDLISSLESLKKGNRKEATDILFGIRTLARGNLGTVEAKRVDEIFRRRVKDSGEPLGIRCITLGST